MLPFVEMPYSQYDYVKMNKIKKSAENGLKPRLFDRVINFEKYEL